MDIDGNGFNDIGLRTASGDPQFVLTTDGNVGIGTTSPLGKLDVSTGLGLAFVIGADTNADTLTDATRKFARFGMPHYDLDAQEVLLFVGDSDTTTSTLTFGGGSASYNAATDIEFKAAPDNVTLNGDAILSIDYDGVIAEKNLTVAVDFLVVGDSLLNFTQINKTVTPSDLGDFDNYQLVISGGGTTGNTAGLLLSTSADTYGGSAILHYDTGAGGI